jgi:hypothetical protein
LGKLRKLIQASESGFNDHILTLDVSPLSEALLESLEKARGGLALTQEADPVDLTRLRVGSGAGQNDEAGRRE